TAPRRPGRREPSPDASEPVFLYRTFASTPSMLEPPFPTLVSAGRGVSPDRQEERRMPDTPPTMWSEAPPAEPTSSGDRGPAFAWGPASPPPPPIPPVDPQPAPPPQPPAPPAASPSLPGPPAPGPGGVGTAGPG